MKTVWAGMPYIGWGGGGKTPQLNDNALCRQRESKHLTFPGTL